MVLPVTPVRPGCCRPSTDIPLQKDGSTLGDLLHVEVMPEGHLRKGERKDPPRHNPAVRADRPERF
jgi:hypothetical protein